MFMYRWNICYPQWTTYSGLQIQLSGTLGQHQIAMLNSSCASSRAARLVEGRADSSPTGLQQWDPTRWVNCLTTALTPIIISQTSLQHPTDSQTVLQTEQHPFGNNETRPSHSCAWLTALTSVELGLKIVADTRTYDDEGQKKRWLSDYCYHDNKISTLQQKY